MKTKTLVIAVIAALVLAMAPAAGAQGSNYERKSLELRTTRTAAVTAGDTAWVLLQWKGLTDVDDFRLQASGRDGVEVSYPANTGDHTALMQGSSLKKGRVDVMALRVTVPADAGRQVLVDVKFSWTAFGESRNASTTIRVPVVRYTGADYEIIDRTIRKGDNGDLWAEITYRGLAPSLQDFRVTVPDADGLDLYFPRRDHSSLNGDAELEDGETDFVRFRISEADADKLSQLAFVTEYQVGRESRGAKDSLRFVGELLGR
ncbi:MAG: hypothetical protein ACE367_06240 [Acidimicrobiales bacterium]